MLSSLLYALLAILGAGFVTGVLCKRLAFSLIAGYFVVGVVIGPSGLGLVSQHHHELEYLAHAGALLLLFSVGIEFSLNELIRLSRYCLIGGVSQMALVALPLSLICLALGLEPRTALLAALSATLSSTVLVFKALSEWGQVSTEHGRRGIGILLFQDVALVPLMLIIPLLASGGEPPTLYMLGILGFKAICYVVAVGVGRKFITGWIIPLLYDLRSVELVVLFTLGLLLASCCGAYSLGLPAAIGALAAGLMLSDNRLSKQIDTIVLPFRELFASVFFVSLGILLQPKVFIEEPLLMMGGVLGILLLKTCAASIALRLTGLPWRASFGMGLGLSQLGEFSFLLLASALVSGAISDQDYNRILFVALVTLIMTPQLIKMGLRWIGGLPDQTAEEMNVQDLSHLIKRAIIVGTGPVGRQAASNLELLGMDVCLIDVSPINLHDYSVQGFHTITGDAREAEVMLRADINHCDMAVICVDNDDVTHQIITGIRELNLEVPVLAHCRYQSNVAKAKLAGANTVLSEEREAYEDLRQAFDGLLKK